LIPVRLWVTFSTRLVHTSPSPDSLPLRAASAIADTTAGAIPDTVSAEAGLLIPPNDIPALAAALRHLIESPEDRAHLAAGARAAAERLPTWAESAKLFSAAIERVV